ncbi:TPA: hypothetical protein OYH96_002857 [Staphylococcus aureus]|nr:hypothetical protein [Staphylococcus aureus]HCW8076641.1 hypothetical protein [Staphylococcus aureus]
MLLEVSIAGEEQYSKDYESDTFNLLSKKGIQEAFEKADILFKNDENYIIVNIDSDDDWAENDPYTLLDDITEVALMIMRMNELQYKIFTNIAVKYCHEPFDIADKVLNNSIVLKTDDDDEIWETALIDNNLYKILE